MSKEINPTLAALPELELLALCMYGEARSEGLDGMLGVGSVIMNRVNAKSWYGTGIKDVILKPQQFSCFNPDDANYSTLLRIAQDFEASVKQLATLQHCYWIAKGILEIYLHSNVGPATHYNTINCDPKWDDDMIFLCRLKRHEFFVEKPTKRKK